MLWFMRTRKGRRLSRVLQVHLSGIIASGGDAFVTLHMAAYRVAYRVGTQSISSAGMGVMMTW
ncbi:hypothetical protein VC35_20685 [Pseudomonas fluorescens]|uniref:Uncharacterized protein n=1 Tax=Pseudomonas fluorescens TaxID=294 RepID=A0A0F4TIZ1_PSEFL|nr:hypothetical protein VC35_20685 [Pseudomonas fluorescens]